MMEILFKRLTKKWDLVYTRYTDKDIKKLWIDREEADYGQIIIQDIKEAKITAIFRNEWKRFNWSLRTKYDNVEKIAKQFGGGGHIHAAGFKLPAEKSFSKQIQKVVKQMISYMKK
jgi:phosphoesterase RecJ-like protein